jgi:hypothetical protein
VRHLSPGNVDLKECFIGLERLDDNVFEQYLNKFEAVNNNSDDAANMFDLNELVEECRAENEFEVYSDEFRVNLDRFVHGKRTAAGAATVDSSVSGGSAQGSARRRGGKKRRKCTDDMVNSFQVDNNEVVVEDEEEEEEEEEDEDLDERTLLERNCFNISSEDAAELNENEDDYFSCEYCTGHYYKFLPQLKVSFFSF